MPELMQASDTDVFQELYSMANDALSHANCGQYTQAVAVQTDDGKNRCTVIPDVLSPDHKAEQAFLAAIRADGCTCIRKLVCVWPAGGVDLPSYDFRRRILALDPHNGDTKILVRGTLGYFSKNLNSTMR